MEAIITIVGFLGAGKTTLLKKLTSHYIQQKFNPFIILNDYENAALDANQFLNSVDPKSIKPLTGNCICCSGINELRETVNRIPKRTNGITLIEANGTSDACTLMEFLGVGLNNRFLPPIQISVVDVKNWQKREQHNELESNQIQISSLIVLTHVKTASTSRQKQVIKELKKINSLVKIIKMEDVDINLLSTLVPSKNNAKKINHLKTHWASCSCNLPSLPNKNCIEEICNAIPKSILRVKGCTIIGNNNHYTYFERTPDGEVFTRPFNGEPVTGPKLLTIGAGSNTHILKEIINNVVKN